MVNITFLEVHLDDASLSADRPFSNLAGSGSDTEQAEEEETDDEQLDAPDWGTETEDADEDSEVPTKALATLGVLLVLVGLAAIVRYLGGGEEPEVDIETPEDDENRPVGVTVDE